MKVLNQRGATMKKTPESKAPCPRCGVPVSETLMEVHKTVCASKGKPPQTPAGDIPPVQAALPEVATVPENPLTLEEQGRRQYLQLLKRMEKKAPVDPLTPDEQSLVGAVDKLTSPENEHQQTQQEIATPPVQNIWTPDWVAEVAAAMIDASNRGERVMALLTGPHGNGKSTLAQQIAARAGRPYLEWPCQRMMEPSDFYVVTKARGGSTIDYKTAFYYAVKTPGIVIHLMEPNRAANPKVINTVIDLTDPTAGYQTTIWELDEVLKLAEGAIIIASINEGYQYTGIDPMDRALKSRFLGLDMELPPIEVLEGILNSNGATPGSGGVFGEVAALVQNMRIGNMSKPAQGKQELAHDLAQWPVFIKDNRIQPEIGVREIKKVWQYLQWGISLEVACRIAVRPICDKADDLAKLLQYAQQSLSIQRSWDTWVQW